MRPSNLSSFLRRSTHRGEGNKITLEVVTCSYRTIRGRTIVAALADGIAFWLTEGSSNPDEQVLAAIRPAMATIPGAKLLCASSPNARRGALWEAYQKWFGKDDAPVLIWQAETRVMNPSVPQRVIDDAYEPTNAIPPLRLLSTARSSEPTLNGC
jgi:hypothetical protein